MCGKIAKERDREHHHLNSEPCKLNLHTNYNNTQSCDFFIDFLVSYWPTTSIYTEVFGAPV